MRSLLVLRHAHTEGTRPAGTDRDRRLTAEGRAQALSVGKHLRDAGVAVDLALCSSAARARQTLEALGLGCAVEVSGELYNAGAETILAEVQMVADDVKTLLLVGHAPGMPALAYGLADPATSDPEALETLDTRFPTGTLATLQVDTPWSRLRSATLTGLHLTDPF